MLHFSLWGAASPLDEMPDGFRRLWDNAGRLQELTEVVDLLQERIHRVTRPVNAEAWVPLQIHARYSRDEALAAFGVGNPGSVRQGVKWVEEERADVFFVTLRKTEKHDSPTTMYQDRAISPSLFQWESQSTTSTTSPTGQRYLHHQDLGTSVHLFIRESKESDGDLGAPPYLYAGPASYVRHSNDRPIQILWKLDVRPAGRYLSCAASPYHSGMAISYEWRGEFTSAEANRLHAECFDHAVLSDGEWDWRGQVDRHSLGWVCAREGGGLVGFVNVAWDGVVHAFVLDTMVATRARREGVGTRLVELAVEGARAAGCEWLHVDFEDHLRGFYFDACGFVPTNAGLIEL